MGEANDRLDFVVRRNRGKTLVNKYREMFVLSGLEEKELKSVDLEKSDEVLNQIRSIFPSVQRQVEVLSDSCTFLDSKLLTSTFAELGSADECYLFSDDVYYCGMFIVTANLRRRAA